MPAGSDKITWMNVSDSAPLARNEAVVFTELDGDVVMLDAKAGRYYELDSVGSRIWTLLEDKPTLAQLRDALAVEFDVGGEALLEDIHQFMSELAKRGLVAEAGDEAE